MADEINRLGWITCPYCGTSFRVGVPTDATKLAPSTSYACGYRFPVTCPRCKKGFTVEYR
ncbi:MAG: CpXC domain-containing protein [Candidatus Thermoplasmatota archaeon]|nr:CpXC domain-containing protein [Candidatus Thermoplasmatota archaeon]MBU4256496.1 CpXC domain-containing protein [Candidatus Thermoplasmatota archaeon]MCG2826474.1 CpXC domain-containing protein [Thermoplasmatales archaeon]